MAEAGELRDLSRRAVALWNSRDFDAFYAEFHPDVIYHAHHGAETRGVDALRARCASVLQWCPDLTITTTLCVADVGASLVASIQIEQGTAANGAPFGFEGMTFFRIGRAMVA